MAFADGELDETVRRVVEQAMAKDAQIGWRIAAYIESRRLVQTALSSEDHLAVPPALHSAIIRQVLAVEGARLKSVETAAAAKPAVNQSTAPSSSYFSRNTMRLAASLAVLAIGTAAFFAGQWMKNDHEPADQSLIARLNSVPVKETLSTAASGQQHGLGAAQLRIVATYRSDNGAICREFILQDASGKANAVACRSNTDWNITFALLEPAQTSSYAPADGSDLMGSYLQSMKAGDPLEPPAEKEILSRLSK
ncbi:anti-sigma factor family protein [Microvirga guangxiensis]|nr:hypothetical protein [Microvirga guangxiensis]